MKPDAAVGGAVDGAWWPRSTDPVAEFPPLVTAMDARGAIRRVSYHLDTWDRTDRKLDVGDLVVRMEGFRATQPDTVSLIRQDYTRIRLLVVPPGTPEGVAHAVLRATATAAATTTVEEILTHNGVATGTNPAPAPTGPHPPAPDGDEREDTGGGATVRRRTTRRTTSSGTTSPTRRSPEDSHNPGGARPAAE